MITHIYVPEYIVAMKDFSLTEKAILGAIVGLSGLTGYCYAKNEDFAELAGVNQRNVRRILEHLKEKKMIRVEVKRHLKKEIKEGKAEWGTERKIFPLVFSGKEEGGGQKRPTGEVKKDLYNKKRRLNKEVFENYPEKVQHDFSVEGHNRVVLHSQLKRLETSFKKNVDPEVLGIVKDGILHYQRTYEKITGTPHPRYKYEQVRDCFTSLFLDIDTLIDDGVEEIPSIVRMAIDYWFSTSTDPNKLRMNHFLGGDSNQCFLNCVEEVV